MRSANSKVPEYPRPVSPIWADEIPICPDTIIYYDSDEGIQEDEQQRATKRRRIESEATAYLRGETLFILTAQLKGPFDNGWQNPWKRRRQATETKKSTARDVADMAVCRPALVTAPSSPAPIPSKRPASSSNSAEASVRQKRSNVFPSETIQDVRLASTKKKAIGAVDCSNAVRSSPQQNQRVEDWLKRNDSSAKLDCSQLSNSSPLTKKSPTARRKKWEPSPVELEMPPVLDAIVHVARSLHDPQQPSTTPLAWSALRQTGAPEGTMKQPRGTARASEPVVNGSRKKGKMLETERRLLPAVGISASLPSSHDHLISSRQPAQEASDRLQEGSAPRPDTTSAGEGSDSRGVLDVASGPVSAPFSTALEEQFPKQIDSILAVSKDRPSTDMPNDLPSAQVPPQPTLPSGPSNVSSNDEMLELLTVPEPPHALGMELTAESAVPAKAGTDLDEHNRSSGSKGADGKHVEIPRPDENSYLKSYDATTSEVGTARRAGPAGETHSPSRINSNARAAKTKKRTSVMTGEKSPGSSQASIKSAMRVAKPATLNQAKVNEKSTLSQSFGYGGQTHRGPSSPSGLKRSPKSSRMMSAPKGILKSSLSASLGPPVSSTNATSSDAKQDAQQVAQLDVMEQGIGLLDDDGFDLDAAIDDLGSFLGTWDAEKEAAQVLNA